MWIHLKEGEGWGKEKSEDKVNQTPCSLISYLQESPSRLRLPLERVQEIFSNIIEKRRLFFLHLEPFLRPGTVGPTSSMWGAEAMESESSKTSRGERFQMAPKSGGQKAKARSKTFQKRKSSWKNIQTALLLYDHIPEGFKTFKLIIIHQRSPCHITRLIKTSFAFSGDRRDCLWVKWSLWNSRRLCNTILGTISQLCHLGITQEQMCLQWMTS